MHGKACDFYSTLAIQQAQRNEHYRQVERLSLERLSQRAMARITGLSRMTVAAMLARQSLPPIAQTLCPLAQRPIVAIDARWSLVDNKGQEIWIWIALERQTPTHGWLGTWGSLCWNLPEVVGLVAPGLP